MRRRALAALAALTVLGAAGGGGGIRAAAAVEREEASTPADGGDGYGLSGDWKVLSYNVAGLPAEISQVTPGVNIPLISPRLEPYDLVLTQEDFDWWQPALDQLDFANYHERLRAQVTHPFRTERHPGPEAVGLDWRTERPTLLVGDGLGVLSRHRLLEVERVPWRGCFGGLDTSDGGAGDCLAMKGFLFTRVELTPGVQVDVYDLHNEAGGTGEDQRIQEEAMEQLAAFIERRSAGRAVLVAGDTNLHTGSTADRVIWQDFLARTGLVDVCDLVPCTQREAIDKAAVRDGGGVSLDVVSRDYVRDDFRDAQGADLSDHPPLEVVLQWRK